MAKRKFQELLTIKETQTVPMKEFDSFYRSESGNES